MSQLPLKPPSSISMTDGDGPPGPRDSRSSPVYTRLQWSVGDKSTTLEQLKKWHRIKSIMCPSCSITLIGEERTKNVSIRQSGTIVELQHSQCKVAKAKKIFVCKECGFTSTQHGKKLFRRCVLSLDSHRLKQMGIVPIKKKVKNVKHVYIESDELDEFVDNSGRCFSCIQGCAFLRF